MLERNRIDMQMSGGGQAVARSNNAELRMLIPQLLEPLPDVTIVDQVWRLINQPVFSFGQDGIEPVCSCKLNVRSVNI